jgi:hypothetical protein
MDFTLRSNAAIGLKSDGTLLAWGNSSLSGTVSGLNPQPATQIGNDSDWRALEAYMGRIQ